MKNLLIWFLMKSLNNFMCITYIFLVELYGRWKLSWYVTQLSSSSLGVKRQILVSLVNPQEKHFLIVYIVNTLLKTSAIYLIDPIFLILLAHWILTSHWWTGWWHVAADSRNFCVPQKDVYLSMIMRLFGSLFFQLLGLIWTAQPFGCQSRMRPSRLVL